MYWINLYFHKEYDFLLGERERHDVLTADNFFDKERKIERKNKCQRK